ncbi:MAG: CapA family protein, partial [Omnitrophica WOR_2 bacterium]
MSMFWKKLKAPWIKWVRNRLDNPNGSLSFQIRSWSGVLLLPVLFLLVGCQAPLEPALTATVFTSRLPMVFSNQATLTPFAPLAPTRIAATAFPFTPTQAASPTVQASPALPPRIKLLFTGVIVPARCVQAAIDAKDNAGYIYDEVRATIQKADLAVGTLNATISDYPPHTGCIFTYVLVGDSRNADALKNAGFDVMSVATNHIKNCGIGDCGDRAFLDTLENLRRVEIVPVGAGKNLAQALKPVVVTVKGVCFGIVSLGMIEPITFATADTPGIAVLDDDNLRSAIARARKISDVVIAMPHMGPEDSPLAMEYQQHYARVAVEA